MSKFDAMVKVIVSADHVMEARAIVNRLIDEIPDAHGVRDAHEIVATVESVTLSTVQAVTMLLTQDEQAIIAETLIAFRASKIDDHGTMTR